MQRATGRFQDLVQENKDDVLVHKLCLLRCRQGDICFPGNSVQILGGEQAWGGRSDDEKHLEIGHRRENCASNLHLWRTGKGRQQWTDRTGIFWKALKYARTVLQGRCHMWVNATSSVTQLPLSGILYNSPEFWFSMCCAYLYHRIYVHLNKYFHL